jgi:hypothetical protein
MVIFGISDIPKKTECTIINWEVNFQLDVQSWINFNLLYDDTTYDMF